MLQKTYEMDPGHGTAKGTFFSLLILYQFFFYVVAGLAIFGVVYTRSVGDLQPTVAFLASAMCALLFNILLLLFYESYLHSRYPGVVRKENGEYDTRGPSNYTESKYLLILALGTSAILTLIIGAIWTAVTLR